MIAYETLCQALDDWKAGRRPQTATLDTASEAASEDMAGMAEEESSAYGEYEENSEAEVVAAQDLDSDSLYVDDVETDAPEEVAEVPAEDDPNALSDPGDPSAEVEPQAGDDPELSLPEDDD